VVLLLPLLLLLLHAQHFVLRGWELTLNLFHFKKDAIKIRVTYVTVK